ncbi:MAG TPA: recombination mediator RecR [Chloroflexota bacterium]|nr:recombination mediator RecR [Chloroflexota bacterium]
MQPVAEPVARLIEEFAKLPGIGPKTAQRLTYYLLRSSKEEADGLAEAILWMKEKVGFCSTCFNISENDLCGVCADEGRDRGVICVVEEPLDVLALERTREYKGSYHVLHGAISPIDGVGPEKLRIAELVARVRGGSVREVIIATNPNTEGDVTAAYLARVLTAEGVKVTRLARGLPAGGDLEYADELTLARALEGRRPI